MRHLPFVALLLLLAALACAVLLLRGENLAGEPAPATKETDAVASTSLAGENDSTPAPLEAAEGGKISGKLTDSVGTPLEGAELTLFRQHQLHPLRPPELEEIARGKTDAVGTFELRSQNSPWMGRTTLRVRHPRCVTTLIQDLYGLPHRRLGTLSLAAGFELRGRVTLNDRPLGGVELAVTDMGERQGPRWLAQSDHDGRFHLRGLPEPQFAVELHADNVQSRRVLVDTARATSLALQSNPQAELGGRVVSGSPPRPVPGVRVRVQRSDSPSSCAADRLTDESGRFAFQSLAPGYYLLHLDHPAHDFLQVHRVHTDVVDLRLTLPSLGGASWRVIGPQPVALLACLLGPEEGQGARGALVRATQDSPGQWSCALPPGRWRLRILRPRTAPFVSPPFDVVAGQLTPLGEVDARRESTVEGRLIGHPTKLSPSQALAARAVIVPLRDCGTRRPSQCATRREVSVTADGSFQFDGLDIGEYRLELLVPDRVPETRNLDLVGRHLRLEDLAMRPACKLTGIVRQRDGGPAPHVQIDLKTPTARRHTRSDSLGRYLFEELEPGPASLAVLRDQHSVEDSLARALNAESAPRTRVKLLAGRTQQDLRLR